MRLELEHPEKQFYKPCRLCQYMKATDLENVYETLRDEPADRRITVPDEVREGAARAMLKMIELRERADAQRRSSRPGRTRPSA